MGVDLELVPKQKRPAGVRCCEPVVYPDIEREEAVRMASVAKALGDPVRLQLVDVLRRHAGKVCVCELVPLFDLSQPTVSHHLKALRRLLPASAVAAAVLALAGTAGANTLRSVPSTVGDCTLTAQLQDAFPYSDAYGDAWL